MKIFRPSIMLLALALLAPATSAQAQSASGLKSLKGPQKSAQGESRAGADSVADSGADSPAKLKESFISATEEYKASLRNLLATYESNARKVEERAGKLKELFNEGLIARRELEESDAAVAEARVKIEEARNQLAAADLAIAEARRQPEFKPYTPPPDALWQDAAWTSGNARIDALIRQNGQRFGVDPYLVYCVMQQESHFNPYIVSPKGAMGLMQLMPDTAVRFGVVNAYDPAQNIMAGTRYLKELMKMFGNRVELVLASYNAGEGAVIKFGQRIPPYRETLDYVRLISARYMRRPK